MSSFTVVSYYTPKFEGFLAGLQGDCQRLGYPIRCERRDGEFDHLIQAFDYKIAFIRKMIETHGRVLWLDVECRIVKPIPEHWSSPLISTYETERSSGFSSGVLMLDESHLEFIDLWMKYAVKYPRYPDDFVIDFLSRLVDIEFMTIPLEFYDRGTECPVARGLWKNSHTVIQHPTINRWPEPLKYRRAFGGKLRERRSQRESRSRQRKGIFYRNFGGSVSRIEAVMQARSEKEYRDSDWVFDAVRQVYAPERYWPEIADDFTSKPRSFDKSRENFNKPPKRRSFRSIAIRKMRLDAADARQYGHPRLPGCRSLITRLRQSLT